MVRSASSFPDGLQGGQHSGAVVVVPRPAEGSAAPQPINNTLVFGQLDNFFGSVLGKANASSNGNGEAPAACTGVMVGFRSIPSAYESQSVLVLASASEDDDMSFTTTATTATTTTTTTTPAGMAGMPAGGINQAVQKWGDTLLAQHGGKARSAVNGPAASERALYFGYSTTGMYHHNPCDGLENCSTWEGTLVQVHEDLRRRNVPYRWMLIDSYWYGETRYHGNWLWEGGPWLTTSQLPTYPQRFAHGLEWMHDRLGGMRFAAHSGHWARNTPYANASDPRFINDSIWARSGGGEPQYPLDRKLWDHLFTANKAWGLDLIKQDHISENAIMPDDPSAWQRWFDGMAFAAADHDVRIMYCMAFAPVLLNSVRYKAAEATRASADYIVGHRDPGGTNGQWQIGPDAMFHWALGLLPYKDTFYSNTTEHATRGLSPDFNGKEPHPEVHALMAALSGAFVTVSDSVGSANTTLLSTLYRTDGRLLKPTRPVTALDAQLLDNIFGGGSGGAIYSTHTAVPTSSSTSSMTAAAQEEEAAAVAAEGPGDLRWTFVTGVTLTSSFTLLPAHVGIGTQGAKYQSPAVTGYVAFSHHPFDAAAATIGSLEIASFDATHPRVIPGENVAAAAAAAEKGGAAGGDKYAISYNVLAPVFDGAVAVLGELSKAVPVAEGRFKSLSVATTAMGTSLSLGLEGAPGEHVSIAFAELSSSSSSSGGAGGSWTMRTVDCVVAAAGTVVMQYPSGTCADE